MFLSTTTPSFTIENLQRLLRSLAAAILVVQCFVLPTPVLGQQGNQEKLERISELIRRQIEREHLAGVAVCVLERGTPVYSEAFGYADWSTSRRLTKDTPFQIASLSKQFAAASIMLLVREGAIKLDDKISQHMDQLPSAWNDITIRQLLSHSSGIKDYVEFPNIRQDYQVDLERDEILERIYSYPLDFEPGTDFKYSNSGYLIVGHLIEEVAGIEYSEFLNKRVFAPLGMDHSRLEPLQNKDNHRAIGHDYADGEFNHSTYNSPAWAFAAGGILSSLNDLAKWDAAIDKCTILTKEELSTVWQPQRINEKESEFGLAWMVRPAPGGKTFVYHFGNKPGFSVSMARLVEDRVTIIVLSNRTEGKSQQILDSVGKIWMTPDR